MLTYVLAVLGACANATSSVLQRKANRQAPQGQNLSLKLIWSLAHEPVWFGGILAVIAGFLLQAAALGNGQLSVVEPIMVLELPVTLILASRVFGARLHRREWGAAAAMTAGLSGLLYFLSPSGGRPDSVRWYAWVIGIGVNLAFVAAMVGWGRRGPAGHGPHKSQSSARQAAVLAVAAGAMFGLTAALIKGMVRTFSDGIVALFTSWELYGMIAAGGLAMFLLQSAMNAGRLVAAQPGLSLSDPLVSILWGIFVFHERVRGGWYIALAAGSGLVMAFAVVVLARSPLLAGETAQREQPDETNDQTRGGAGEALAAAGRADMLVAGTDVGRAGSFTMPPGCMAEILTLHLYRRSSWPAAAAHAVRRQGQVVLGRVHRRKHRSQRRGRVLRGQSRPRRVRQCAVLRSPPAPACASPTWPSAWPTPILRRRGAPCPAQSAAYTGNRVASVRYDAVLRSRDDVSFPAAPGPSALCASPAVAVPPSSDPGSDEPASMATWLPNLRRASAAGIGRPAPAFDDGADPRIAPEFLDTPWIT